MDRNKDHNFNRLRRPLPRFNEGVYRHAPVNSHVSHGSKQQNSASRPIKPAVVGEKVLRQAKDKTRFVRLFLSVPLLFRVVIGVMILLILAEIIFPIIQGRQDENKYDLAKFESVLLTEPIKQYDAKLVYSQKDKKYFFNKDNTNLGELVGDTSSPKISAEFGDKEQGISVIDLAHNISLTMKPGFNVGLPQKNQSRVVYPVTGMDATKVYSLQATGVKEDIILHKFHEKEMSFDYELGLPAGTEARLEPDGSIGVYGIDSPMLGDVKTATEKDAQLLEKARKNGAKTKLVFSIPKPVILEGIKKESKASAQYTLVGNTLTIKAMGLDQANYPLSIDPTIYIESARKLMKGNNETNIDFDTTNQLIQKSQTTGARIDGWVDSVDMAAGLWDHSMAAAGGYVYRAGGRIDPTMPYIASQQSSVQTTDSTTFTMNMPTTRPAGDLYVALIAHDAAMTVTPPAGWTEYADNDAGGGSTREHAAYYKIGTDAGGGNEAASYVWTGAASEQWVGVIVRIKGFDPVNPIACTPLPSCTGRGFNASDGIPQFPAVTPNTDASLILRAAAIDDDDPSEYTWLPSGHTKVFSGASLVANANSAGLVVATLDQPPLATNAAAAANLASDGILVDSYGSSSLPIRAATVTAGYQNTVEWAQFNDTTYAIDSPNPGTGTCNGWCSNSAYNLPANRVGMSMTTYNGYLYALGGTTNGTAANGTNTVWVAKLGANGEPQLWHPMGGTPAYWFASSNTLPSARSYTSIAAYKNKLYLVGGRDTAGASINTVHAADILPTGDISAWSTTNMQDLTTPTARFGHSIHIYNDFMYIIGGNNNGTLRNTVFYSKLTSTGGMNAWQATSNFTTARASFGGQMTAVWGAYIYMSGGCTALTGGFCSTVASDVQLASINADGSLSPWNSIATLSNQRIGHNFMAWQGGLYRAGGCNRQNTSTGVCFATHRNVEFGAVNPPGDASTVSNSEPDTFAPCSGVSPVNCDLPPAGDAAGQGGQMSSMVVINNGFIYNIGGCTNIGTTEECYNGASEMSGNVAYAALSSTGQMVAPAVCASPNTSYGLWCVDNTNRINGTTGVGTGAVTVFNNYVYVVGGTNGDNWQANVWSVLLNADGSLSGAWSTQTFANLDLGTARGYSYAFTRANPSAASTYPGNLYVIGGCNLGTAGNGIGCNTYFNGVYKCNILPSGLLEEDDLNDCTTAGQLQVDADITAGATGNQGIGLMSGTVYANRVYLVGGACPVAGTLGPCRSPFNANREVTMFAAIDNNNDIVSTDGGSNWTFATALMDPVRRRAVAFGYNGYIYSLAGFSGSASLQDLLFSKIDVSTGQLSAWDSSGVVVTPRWDLRTIVSNGYVYAIGGCGTGGAPDQCTAMQPEVQTFQLYNNDSGTPIGYTASTNQFATDRIGASSVILNGYLYVAGGCTSNDDCSTTTDSVQYTQIDDYGNLTNAWNTGGALPATRAWGQLEAVQNTLYYIGGQDNTATNEYETIYYTTGITSGNPTWGTVGAANDLPDGRTKFSSTVWDDRIYVTGGYDSTGAVSNVTYISPKLTGGIIGAAWTTSTNTFNIARFGHSAVAYANNIYIMGGSNGTQYLSDVQYTSIGYKAGTIQQTGSAITGTGTAWTTAMIGSTLQYRDGEIATILTVPSGTSMTVSVSKTLPSGTGYTVLDGSLGTWSYTTSLPEPIIQADAFAANGYMYLVGGRSSDVDCVPNTLLAPISANTTIATGNNSTGLGEWYETNARYSGDRYGNAVAYANGKMYVTGGGCELFPSVSSVSTQAFNTDTIPHNVTMPATVDPGDLLLVLFSSDTDAAVTTPAGWTAVASATRGANIRGSVFAIDAVGTEDGTNVNFETANAQQASAQVYRIPANRWHGTVATGVNAATVDPGGTTTTPDPPNLDPGSWGTQNTLWLAYSAGSEYASVTTYPTNYTNGTHTGSTGGVAADRATTSSARRESRVASENPAAFTMPSNSNGVALTIAIRPAGVSYTEGNRTVQSGLYSQPQVASYSRMIDTDTDVFPTSWLMNGLDNSIGARWRMSYRSMHDINPVSGGSDSVLTTPPSTYTLQQNPNEDCGTSATMAPMTGWGQESTAANVILGNVSTYTARNSGGGNINCARYYYFYVTIDASQTFGYPEDVNRGPTISDLSLFFTSDPSKRLRHGKTFTGGEQQPLDTPCRQSVDADCPLP